MNTTPASLLERLRRPGDEQAWGRFVELYTPLLYFWARRMGCQESDAADFVQEALALLVRKLPEFTYDRHQSFRSWLRTVAHNCWRNLRRRAELPLIAEADDWPAAAADEPFWEVEYRQFLVRRALDLMRVEFQPTTWQACWRCVVEAVPAAQVARELGLSVGAVYMAKSRVLSRLRSELRDLAD